MSSVSIDTVISASLINRFRGLAGGGSTDAGQQVVQALQGNSGAVSVATGLRAGAQIMSNSVKNLNNVISVANLSHSLLGDLGELTDKMIALSERASRAGVGSSTRNELDRQFKKLGSQFLRTLDRAKLGDAQILTVDGLSQIFQNVGLDKENSDSIAKVFAQFITTKKDDALASPYERGKRPVVVPRAAFSGPASDTTYNPEKITDSNVSGAAQVTTGGNVFIDNDNILNQNPGYDSIFIRGNSGTISSLQAGTLDRNFDTLAINEHTGYTLIGTTQDFGNNASNDYVAYLLDNTGQIVHRFENFDPNPGWSFENVTDFQISSDNLTISYIQVEADATDRSYRVMKQVASSFSTNGGTSVASEVDLTSYNYSLGDPVNSFDTLRMSDDGSNFAYNQLDGGMGSYYTVFDATTAARGTPLEKFEFLSDNTLIYFESGSGEIVSHEQGSIIQGTLVSGLTDVQHLKAVQASAGNSGYLVFDSDIGGGERRIAMYSAQSLAVLYSLDLDAGDTISSLSICYNAAGQPEMGVLGSLASLAGDSDTELYRFGLSAHTTGQRCERMSQEFQSLFSSDANIRSRPNAFRMSVDLKALRKQIDENLIALDDALKTLGKNLELARATGLAFLDASQTIGSAADASAVASALRSAIRNNAPQALSQAENLEPIIVAALALDITA